MRQDHPPALFMRFQWQAKVHPREPGSLFQLLTEHGWWVGASMWVSLKQPHWKVCPQHGWWPSQGCVDTVRTLVLLYLHVWSSPSLRPLEPYAIGTEFHETDWKKWLFTQEGPMTPHTFYGGTSVVNQTSRDDLLWAGPAALLRMVPIWLRGSS